MSCVLALPDKSPQIIENFCHTLLKYVNPKMLNTRVINSGTQNVPKQQKKCQLK